MSENKRIQIGIGYTKYIFEDGEKRPVGMAEVRPGNAEMEIKRLEKWVRAQKTKNSRLFQLCLGAFAYGYMVRFVLGM